MLVEYGFIDNRDDARRLNNNIEKYAEAVVKAIATYAGYNYTPPSETSQPSQPENRYIVQQGDTLYSIARLFNTTVQEIKRLNNLSSNIISPGMELILSENISDTTTYTVSKGDTLYSIAAKFNTTVQEIKDINNLTSNVLSIGQQLLIPTSTTPETPEPPVEPEIPTEPEQPTEPEPPTTPDTQIYIVKKGDSLWLIAKNNNTTVDELIKLNNLSSINLQIGDQLLIPKQPEPVTYIVKRGDTLWTIARSANTTVDEIKRLNNLTSNLLTIGQQLILPN